MPERTGFIRPVLDITTLKYRRFITDLEKTLTSGIGNLSEIEDNPIQQAASRFARESQGIM